MGVGHKPGSVVGHHSSRTRITPCLKQPTRGLRPGRPRTPSYLVLLRAGFTELAASLRQLVGSYPTVAPFLPAPTLTGGFSQDVHPVKVGAGGGIFSVALSQDRSCWALPSALPCGARTFLPAPTLTEGLTWIASIPSKWVQGDGQSNSQRGDTYSAAGSQCIPEGEDSLEEVTPGSRSILSWVFP
jgi:hypothetical protein